MNPYRKSMFIAYSYPSAIFIGFPVVVLSLFDLSKGLFAAIYMALLFFLPVYLSGYILAPIFGPKCVLDKSKAFLMVFLSLASIGVTVSILALSNAGSWASLEFSISFAFFISLIIFIAGIFPTLLAAFIFIGQCENIQKDI